MRIRTFFGVFALAGGCVTPAFATDLYTPPPPVYTPPTAVPANWAGPYLGFQLGVTAGNDGSLKTGAIAVGPGGTSFVTNSSFNGDSSDDSQFLGGVAAGYNLQRGRFVFGGEADISFLDEDSLRSSSTAAIEGGDPAITVKSRSDARVDWFGTVRGRLGYTFGNFMPYGTGGWAYGEVSNRGKVTYSGQSAGQAFNNTVRFGDSDVEFGWTAGAGLDYMIHRSTHDWLVNFTWLYVNLDDHSASSRFFVSNAPLTAIVGNASNNVDGKFHVFRGGLSIKF